MKRTILIYGLSLAVLIFLLKLIEYKFVVRYLSFLAESRQGLCE